MTIINTLAGLLRNGLTRTPVARLVPGRRPLVAHYSSVGAYQEGDRVLICGRKSNLTKPLKPDGHMNTHRGTLSHNDIIGKKARELVRSDKGAIFRVATPSLEDYVTLTPRLVTPVYPADANLIVSLLDIHVATPTPTSTSASGPNPGPESEVSAPVSFDDGQKLEILEAGTGHGSLTLHLARAIHAANPPPPFPLNQRSSPKTTPKPKSESLSEPIPSDYEGESKLDNDNDNEARLQEREQQLHQWRAARRAIIHTVDISPAYTKHARSIVHGFRRGMYAADVEFYTSPVEDWIASQLQQRRSDSHSHSHSDSDSNHQSAEVDNGKENDNESGASAPFLQYAILDMPESQMRIPAVAQALKEDGLLIVFMPSITQIGECVTLIGEMNLPFALERTVELGTGISGGRLWDVRTANVRRKEQHQGLEKNNDAVAGDQDQDQEQEHEQQQPEQQLQSQKAASVEKTVMVCRPKVYERIVGGGFVGIWRKIGASKNDERNGT